MPAAPFSARTLAIRYKGVAQPTGWSGEEYLRETLDLEATAMSLSKSERRKLPQVFQDILVSMIRHLSSAGLDDNVARPFRQLIEAGATAGMIATTLDPLESLWPADQRDEQRRENAARVTGVFTLVMASRYLAMLSMRGRANSPEFEYFQRSLLSAVARFFGEVDSLDYFAAVNRQYQADFANKNRGDLADILYINDAANRLGANRQRYPYPTELPLHAYSQVQLRDMGISLPSFSTQLTLISTFNSIAKEALIGVAKDTLTELLGMYIWRITYRDMSSPEEKYFETDAPTGDIALEIFMDFVRENQIALRLPRIGEQGGQPVVGFQIHVLANGDWVHPGVLGL